MKSKFKENGKNRILAVIASAVMFCLVVLLIIVTRKTDAVADTSVIINGKEFPRKMYSRSPWALGVDDVEVKIYTNSTKKISKKYPFQILMK